MSRFVKIMLLMLIASLLTAVPLLMAQEQEPPSYPANSISGIVANSAQFSTLRAALELAQLQDALAGGSWTVFAPTNAAFAALGLDAENIGDSYSAEELRGLLLYHALGEQLSTAQLKGMLGDVAMANGQIAGLKFYDGDIYVNDTVKVTGPNVLADNGYVHIVDGLILPPWPRDTSDEEARQARRLERIEESVAQTDAELAEMGIPPNSVAGVAYADGRFDTFGAAMVAAGLADQLSTGLWTAFIPTDAAFAALGLDQENIADAFTPEELADLLLYHMLPGEYSVGTLRTILGDVTMANGEPAGLKFFRGRIWVNDESRMRHRDIDVENGVVHGMDQVILPPWPRVEVQEAPVLETGQGRQEIP